VKVDGNWRLTFKFEESDAVLVDYTDYHQENLMSGMHNSPHPGETLREEWARRDIANDGVTSGSLARG
jgi:hypothetical protein